VDTAEAKMICQGARAGAYELAHTRQFKRERQYQDGAYEGERRQQCAQRAMVHWRLGRRIVASLRQGLRTMRCADDN
jgi:hypothetical protein